MLGIDHTKADRLISENEESKLREFRNRLTLDTASANQDAADQL